MPENKILLLLYPDTKHIQAEIERVGKNNEGIASMKKYFFEIFNGIITKRYREKEYTIWIVMYTGMKISELITINSEDRLMDVGFTFDYANRNNVYADWEKILHSLTRPSQLILGGYFASDCVEKCAKTAYEMGYAVKVDEDLTDMASYRIAKRLPFTLDKYPSLDLKNMRDEERMFYLEARKSPWLWQDDWNVYR